MAENYKSRDEYIEGYTMGRVAGERDANMLVPPYPHTEEGTEFYQVGFTNGYFSRYTQGLSAILRENPSVETSEIIATRLEEISESMILENEKTNKSTK